MITGDYPATARAIARQAGFDTEDCVSGDELERLSEAELALRVQATTVFARIMPEQKLRIVNAFKANGEIVAMTGDGVNDAPSLKAAHIGIAMGGRGTDVGARAVVWRVGGGARRSAHVRSADRHVLHVKVERSGPGRDCASEFSVHV